VKGTAGRARISHHASKIDGMRTSAELREGFLAFFESKGHKRHPSASLIPRVDDRSTLLTSAGMQPLMPYFLGREEPPAPLLTVAQKSFRTQDIEEVGSDGHHLTFFEMLGNFSFGQYFKDGAVDLAKEFVLEHMRLDWDRIWATVFAGDPELGLGEDEAAIAAWERVGMPRDRIVPLPRSENFWWVGGPGPCGPDSELYYDWGEEHGCGEPDCAPACTRCERFLEFWNLVFMSFELHEDGTVTPLPAQNIDTGLGLERGAAILQDVMTVYETDGYQAIMEWIGAESGVRYGESEQATKAHRILADHGRAMTFLAADGVTPSNEGRGYVLRRIIRRAVQQAQRIGLSDVWRLPVVVVEQMGGVYPELSEQADEIERVIRGEDERFSETLSRGLVLFEELAARGDITGGDAFKLHDTYGFPVEMTVELARERGLAVDEDEFARLMEEQRERSRSGTAGTDMAIAGGPQTDFVGYEKTEVLTAIAALDEDEPGVFRAKLFESPFYAEGGGQVSDTGFIENEQTGARAVLVRAVRVGDDQTLLFEGEAFAVGDRVRAVVPWSHRFPTMANHTATHLLHKALQEVLGDHVRQAGSAVRPDKLRFDFTHPQALAHDERVEIEKRVNEKVFESLPVLTYVVPINEAEKLGATMLFGEKYGEDVRVVEIPGYSMELCGGTHVRTTAEIGPFVILSESSVGAGARRIEAVTSGEAYAYLHARLNDVEALRGQLEQVRKEKPKADSAARADVEADVKVVDGVHVIVQRVDGLDADALLDLSDRFKQQNAPAAVALGTTTNGRVHLVCNFDQVVAERVSASDVARAAAAVVGGGGGGRPTMARAGGTDPGKLPDALAEAERLIVGALSS
jgi:alanyl-tRNA synthetase